jgi:hypothetical protein
LEPVDESIDESHGDQDTTQICVLEIVLLSKEREYRDQVDIEERDLEVDSQ